MRKAPTRADIAKLRPGDYLADTNMPGLRVEASALTKFFAYRFRELATGRLLQVKIGDATQMPISEARDALRELVVNGNPRTNEQLALVGLTARDCAKVVRA